jgi:filamentous hemagglutinin
MPNSVATEALSKQMYDAHTDCSELAHRLRDAAGTGRILRVEPAVRGTLRLLEDGLIEGDMYYHEAYTDGAYVFDVRVSKTPIPKGDWTSVIMKLNPGARIK